MWVVEKGHPNPGGLGPGASAWAIGSGGCSPVTQATVTQLGPGPCESCSLGETSWCVHVHEDTYAHV